MTATVNATATGVVEALMFLATATSAPGDGDNEPRFRDRMKNQRDLYTQTVISVALGLSAFLGFCTLRPRWKTLYAARKTQRCAASRLPELPDTFFGWIPVLYRITGEEVLASAGLDAYVFLSFFKYAIKFLSVVFFFALVVIMPLHYTYIGDIGFPGNGGGDGDDGDGSGNSSMALRRRVVEPKDFSTDPTYLWIYAVFTYLFSGLALFFLVQQTNEIIQTRQRYLASLNTTTDRTIRLSGIPPELRSEERIKEFLENLEIGKVDRVTLCRDWRELDVLIEERMKILRKLERAWTEHLGYRPSSHKRRSLPFVRSRPRAQSIDLDEHGEQSGLLSGDDTDQDHVSSYARERPKTRVWYGPFKLQYKSIDAIDYYEEKLRRLDERIVEARQKEYPPMPLAFVTMESIAACQMCVQAILDPWPMTLLTSLAPPPSNIVWKNTYLPRTERMARSWTISLIVGFLTVIFSALLVPFALSLNLDTIAKVLPQFAELLADHPIAKSLIQTGLPTLVLSLLTIAVPYVNEWLTSLQGMASQGDMELSLISKNFFFTFFTSFLVFTVFGTASNFYGLWENLRDVFKDTTTVAFALAQSLETLAPFYVNLIILQGLGLFPFRLLEFGSVALYPINRLLSKTPRDYAELSRPPTFSYAFSLPHTMLIFIVCVVYSVFPNSWLVCLFGLIYFSLGGFIYKYQLLYAMDHQQHSTGRAWAMISSRVIVGLIVFQLAMIGSLALRKAITKSIILVPLLAGTVWFTYFFARTYEPLMKFIALKSIDRDAPRESDESPSSSAILSPRDSIRLDMAGTEIGPHLKKYVNPNLLVPLDGPWIPGRRIPNSASNHLGESNEPDSSAV